MTTPQRPQRREAMRLSLLAAAVIACAGAALALLRAPAEPALNDVHVGPLVAEPLAVASAPVETVPSAADVFAHGSPGFADPAAPTF